MPEEATVSTETTPLSESTTVPEYGVNGDAQEAHFQAALAAAEKEVATKDPGKADPVKVQEAADAEALKAKEKDEAEAKADAVKDDEKEAVKKDDEADKPAESPGTLGKFRRLFQDGKIEESFKLVGIDLEKFEPRTKAWKEVKRIASEAKQEAAQVRDEAAKETGRAQYVIQQLQPFIQGAQAYINQDFATFLKLTTGDTPEEFQRKLIGQLHEAPKTDPAALARIERLEREAAAKDAALAAQRRQWEEQTAQQRYQEAQANAKKDISTQLKEGPYAKVATKQLFVDKVYDLMVSNYDAKTKMTIDPADAAEIVWDELYGDVVPAGGQAGNNPVSREKDTKTAAAGSSLPTTLKHSQTTEASPELAPEWSPENQEKLLEFWTRKAKSEILAKDLS